MFNIIVVLKSKKIDDIEKIASTLKMISEITLKEEPGCKKLDVYHSQENKRIFFLCEEWDSRDDWVLHREKKAYKELYAPIVLPLVERDPHISFLLK